MGLCAFYVPARTFHVKCYCIEALNVSLKEATACFLLFYLKMTCFLYIRLYRQAVTMLAEIIYYTILLKLFLIIQPLERDDFCESGWSKLRSQSCCCSLQAIRNSLSAQYCFPHTAVLELSQVNLFLLLFNLQQSTNMTLNHQ